jgi:hypothetical protein
LTAVVFLAVSHATVLRVVYLDHGKVGQFGAVGMVGPPNGKALI